MQAKASFCTPKKGRTANWYPTLPSRWDIFLSSLTEKDLDLIKKREQKYLDYLFSIIILLKKEQYLVK
jgi:hypothetical protein